MCTFEVGGSLILLFLVCLGNVGSRAGYYATSCAALYVGRMSRGSLDELLVEWSRSRKSIQSALLLGLAQSCYVFRHTATMESKMKPAAAASFAPSAEYTRAFTTELVNTRPAAKNPTTLYQSAESRHSSYILLRTAT